MLAPVGMAMLYRVFPPAERVRASSILTVGTTLAPAIGPVLGGLLVTDFTLALGVLRQPADRHRRRDLRRLCLERSAPQEAGVFDIPGFVLGGAGLGLLMYGVSEGPLKSWSSPAVIATCVAGVLLLVALVVVELRTARPMVDLRLLRDRLFRSGNGVMFLTRPDSWACSTSSPCTSRTPVASARCSRASPPSPRPSASWSAPNSPAASSTRGWARGATSPAGCVGLAAMLLVLTQISLTTSLWLIRGIMFLLGLMMAQIFVPTQAASFAMISPESTGRASTSSTRASGRERDRAWPSSPPCSSASGSAQASGGTCTPDLTGLPPGLPHRGGLRPGRRRLLPHHPRQ